MANGKPANKQDSAPTQNELYKLLEYLYQQQGKYNIAISRYSDGLSTEYEVKTNSNIRDDEKPYNRHQNYNNQNERQYPLHIIDLTNAQNLNPFLRRPLIVARVGDNTNNTSNCMQTYGECKEIMWDNGTTRANLEYENVDEVLELLNEFDKNMESNGYYDVENYDMYRNGNVRDRDDDDINYRQNLDSDDNNDRDDNYLDSVADRDINGIGNLRCIGNKCSRSGNYRDDNNRNDGDDVDEYDLTGLGVQDRNERYDRYYGDTNYREDRRCIGDRCERSRNNRDAKDWNDNGRRDYIIYDVDRDNLRCIGDRCSRIRNNRDDDDRNNRDDLRCIGNRCGRSKSDRDYDNDGNYREDDMNYLRCIGNRCGRSSNNRDDDNGNNRNYYIHDLRCVGERCGRNSDDRDDDNRDDYSNDLRCVGDRCGRSRNDSEDKESKNNHQANDDLDEVSLDTSDIDNILSNLDAIDNKYFKDLKDLKLNDEINKILGEREALLEQIKNMLSQNKA